jgi:hypothetical protein
MRTKQHLRSCCGILAPTRLEQPLELRGGVGNTHGASQAQAQRHAAEDRAVAGATAEGGVDERGADGERVSLAAADGEPACRPPCVLASGRRSPVAELGRRFGDELAASTSPCSIPSSAAPSRCPSCEQGMGYTWQALNFSKPLTAAAGPVSDEPSVAPRPELLGPGITLRAGRPADRQTIMLAAAPGPVICGDRYPSPPSTSGLSL